jgi:hypothetical protein
MAVVETYVSHHARIIIIIIIIAFFGIVPGYARCC